jgi:hypothetical protein
MEVKMYGSLIQRKLAPDQIRECVWNISAQNTDLKKFNNPEQKEKDGMHY